MAEIVDFKTKLTELSSSNIKEILEELLQQVTSIKDVCLFFKDVESNHIMYYSNGLSLPDKAFFSKMLDHDIMTELSSTEDDLDEQDL